MKYAAIAVCLLLLVYRSNAVFDARVNGNTNGGSLTNILDCTVDGGGRFQVGTTPAGPHDFWLPAVTSFQYPGALQWVSRDPFVLEQLLPALQGIDLRLQSLFQTDEALMMDIDTSEQTDENRFCNRSLFNDDEDDPAFIVETLLVDRVRNSGIDNLTFSNNTRADAEDEIAAMEALFDALRCETVYRWADLGPTFLPRYVVGGRCLSRNCSFPIDQGQHCRQDAVNSERLIALRWDCCWGYDRVNRVQTFECGWRRVTIPILCDCDCACLQRN